MEEELFVNESIKDDPVVSEMPVFLNNHAGDSLVLLQYPTRKADQTYKASQVRLKPASQVIETDLDSNVPAQFIDASNGSTLQGLTQTYGGVLKENQGGKFALGYVKDKAMHISLVSRAGQMRPKFASHSSTLLQPSMLQANAHSKSAEQPALRSVQMSVKSTSTEMPKHSGVLEFWRQANKEENVEFATEELAAEKELELLAAEGERDETVLLPTDLDMNFL